MVPTVEQLNRLENMPEECRVVGHEEARGILVRGPGGRTVRVKRDGSITAVGKHALEDLLEKDIDRLFPRRCLERV